MNYNCEHDENKPYNGLGETCEIAYYKYLHNHWYCALIDSPNVSYSSAGAQENYSEILRRKEKLKQLSQVLHCHAEIPWRTSTRE